MTFSQRNLSARGNRMKARGVKAGAGLVERLEPRILMAMDTASVAWGGGTVQAVRNQYVMQSAAASAADLMTALKATGLSPTSVSKLGGGFYQVTNSWDSAATIGWWASQHPNVATAVAPNTVFKKMNTYPSEMTQSVWYGKDAYWWLENTGIISNTNNLNQPVPGVVGADARVTNAWDLGTGNRNLIVAVLDTGGTPTHPDLVGNMFINSKEVADEIDNDGNGVIDDINGANFSVVDADTGVITADGNIADGDGHGTHVAGIIGAQGNNRTTQAGTPPHDNYAAVGINWGVKILPVKVLDDTGAGSLASIIAGIQYVTFMKQVNGYNIVAANLSLGAPYAGPANGIADPTGVAQMYVALNQSTGAGIIYTAAAGNETSSNDILNVAPANYSNGLFLTVAATNSSDQLASFSNFGSRVHLAAPGQDIISTISPTGTIASDDGGLPYGTISGTSMASPMVAGAVALLKSIVPSATPQQIVNAILKGVDVLPQLQGQVTSGGRLNVYRSAQILLGNRPLKASVDVANQNVISGWAYDPNLGNQPVPGVVVVDGVAATYFYANQNRPDLGANAYGSNHGYSINVGALNLTPGDHDIRVLFYDVSQAGGFITNADGSLNAQAKQVFGTTINGNVLPIGWVDQATSARFAGWAWDPNAGVNPITVRVDVDGQTVAVLNADKFHSTSVGDHAFDYTPSLPQGAHRVDFYAIDDFTGQGVLIGTRTVVGNRLPGPEVSGLAYDPVTKIFSGFVVDPNDGFNPVDIQVVYDAENGERQLLTGVANLVQTPPAQTPTYVGNNAHGFAITLLNVAPGNHQIRLFAIDRETGEKVELLYLPLQSVNQTPTGAITGINQNTISGRMTDPNSPGASMFYRIDYSDLADQGGESNRSTGPLFQATTSDGTNATFSVANPPLAPGRHRARLLAVDTQTLDIIQVAQSDFTVNDAVNRKPIGFLDAPGVAGGSTGGGGISGAAGDPSNDTNNLFTTVNVFVDGATSPALTTIANVVRNNAGQNNASTGFEFTVAEIAAKTGPGLHYLQVYAYDTSSTVSDFGTGILLGEGEVTVGGLGVGAAFSDVNFRTLNGTVQANVNDPVPASFANIGGYVPTTTTWSIDVNQRFWTILNQTPTGQGTADPFTIATPQLAQVNGNSVRMRYFDPFIGRIVVLNNGNRTAIDSTPVDNFVSQRLITTGNFAPAGTLDAASQNGIAGWVRDRNTPGTPIKYRLDIDNNVGIPALASDVRGDLPFSDNAHGFTVTPATTPALALLPAGAHTVRLWAIDPETGVSTLLGQRSFTVVDDGNKRPIGGVETLNGTGAQGWVQDPSGPLGNVQIQLFLDGAGTPAATTIASTNRTDLANRNGAPVKGFNIAIPGGTAAGLHHVQIFAVDTSDSSRKILLASNFVYVGASPIGGAFEQADFERIAGWGSSAVNDPAPQFRLEVNGVAYGVPFSGDAPVTESGITLRRFSFATPPMGISSNNTVKLYYIEPNTGTSILIATKVIGPVQPVVAWVDRVTTSIIQGWAYSPSLPNAEVKVQLLVDNVAVATTTAALTRGDLSGAPQGHAFQFNTPPLSPGSHKVTLRFLDPISGDYSILSNTTLVAFA